MRLAAALLAAVALLSGCAQTQHLTPVSPLLGMPLSTRARDHELRRQIADLERKADWQALSALAARAAALDPTDEDWLVVLGYARLQSADYGQAIEILKKASDRSPEDADARNLQGEALRLSGQPGQAIRVLERSVFDQPNVASGWFLLGEAYRDASRLREARQAYGQAVRIEPEFAMGWYGLAGILARSGPQDEYEQVLKRLQALNSSLHELHLKGGRGKP
jgi:cytochrome c-type biogenesis protein CcmH/NrfG